MDLSPPLHKEAKSCLPLCSLYTFLVLFLVKILHTNILIFIQVDYNTFKKNYYIGKVSNQVFLGNLKSLKNCDM